MSDATRDYWSECMAIAAEECGLTLTPEQLACLAEGAAGGHEHYGMAFYSPPASDRISVIEGEWKARLAEKERELEQQHQNNSKALRRALKLWDDTPVSVNEYGEVFAHGGRTVRVL